VLGRVRTKVRLNIYVSVQEPYHIAFGVVSKQIAIPGSDEFLRSKVQGLTKKPICNSLVYSLIQLPIRESKPLAVLFEVVGSMQSTLKSARMVRRK